MAVSNFYRSLPEKKGKPPTGGTLEPGHGAYVRVGRTVVASRIDCSSPFTQTTVASRGKAPAQLKIMKESIMICVP